MALPTGRNALVFWATFLSILSGLGLIAAGHTTAAAACFQIVGIILALALLDGLRNVLAGLLTRGLCKAGDYDRALLRLRRLGLGMPSGFMLVTEGGILNLAGRFAEGEQCFRRALAGDGGPSRTRANTVLNLAFTLDHLGRHDEAKHYFQVVIQLGDVTGSAGIGLASMLLDAHQEPQQALELIERAEATTRPRWTIKARAMAQLGRRQEAELAIEQALREADPNFSPFFAGLHYEVGRAFLDLQEPAKAAEHFRTARDADARGYCGLLAHRKLEELSDQSAAIWPRRSLERITK